MKKVLIAGYFDPIHEGHLDHIMKACQLGDFVYIATHTDECTERVKGKRFTNLTCREFLLRGVIAMIGIIGTVIVTDDTSMAGVIRQWKPDIFAKGGDRTADNMPRSEIEACAEVKCSIVYGIGDQLNSSSLIKREVLNGKANDRESDPLRSQGSSPQNP